MSRYEKNISVRGLGTETWVNSFPQIFVRLKLISADRGLARNGGALKIYNNQLDSTNTVACEKLSNPNGPSLTFLNFCQDLSQTDSPVPGTVPTGNGECVCPWNSDLNQESDLTYQLIKGM